jgi:hypothetical protein
MVGSQLFNNNPLVFSLMLIFLMTLNAKASTIKESYLSKDIFSISQFYETCTASPCNTANIQTQSTKYSIFTIYKIKGDCYPLEDHRQQKIRFEENLDASIYFAEYSFVHLSYKTLGGQAVKLKCFFID